MPSSTRLINMRNRAEGETTSRQTASILVAVPITDGRPDWDTVDGTLVGWLEVETTEPPATFDLVIEASDSANPQSDSWYEIAAATGKPDRGGVDRGGDPYIPRVTYSSTGVVAQFLRLVITADNPCRYAAWIEVM